MNEAFMARPTDVLESYIESGHMARSFELGQLAMSLEVISLIRTLESLPVVNDAEREGTIATLYTLLRENSMEGAFDAYEQLNSWRQVHFLSDNTPRGVSRRARERPGNVAFAANGSALQLVPSSRAAHPGQTLAPSERLRALTLVHQSPGQDASATGGQMALFVGEGTETPSE